MHKRRGRPIQNSKFQHTEFMPAPYRMKCSPVCPSSCATTMHVTVVHQLLIRLQRSPRDEMHMESLYREVYLLGAFQRSCAYFPGFAVPLCQRLLALKCIPRKQSSAATKATGQESLYIYIYSLLGAHGSLPRL